MGTTRQPIRRGSPWRAVQVVVLALLCPWGQTLAAVHEASARHVVCAEHGELTHVQGTDQAADPGSGPVARPGQTSSEHEHCPDLGLVGRRAPTVLSVQVAPPAVVRDALGDPALYPTPGTRLLLSAPKTSPPQA